jgi:hypothetical protein
MNQELDRDTQIFTPGRRSQSIVRPAPSLRVPVIARNRALLRRLRAAELSEWQNASPKTEPVRIPVRKFSDQPFFRVNIGRL